MYSKLFELLNIQKTGLETLLKVINSQREYILLNGHEKFLDTVHRQEKSLSYISNLKLLTLKEFERLKLATKKTHIKKISELIPFIRVTERKKFTDLVNRIKFLWELIQKKSRENRILVTKTSSILNRSLRTLKSYSGDHGGYTKNGNHTSGINPSRRVIDRSI
ncbi:MAG: hypothetical protein CR982_01295 [Candidatus Cloacimonadota bacterium]|nr:MAG: hypothetical protein CR982_01295 [Candidatus Cloacimonadota bacterium]PIE77943.1 MAG: hypothetical protein CSA15_10375 [Candidatus Delongbacteria bacterium]